jgi:hypothetical protein
LSSAQHSESRYPFFNEYKADVNVSPEFTAPYKNLLDNAFSNIIIEVVEKSSGMPSAIFFL